MHNISKLISENRKEAYELLKNNGGRIDFIDNPEGDNINNDAVFEANLPWVGMDDGGDSIADFAVLAAECNGECISILTYSTECEDVEGWRMDAECIYGSENCVYEEIGERLNK